MSDINRIQGNFRGLVVQNKNNNVLKMDQAGNFSLQTKSIENISYQKIINISEKESIYTARNSDLTLCSENGNLHLKNGPPSSTPGYVFTNPDYSPETDEFFSTANATPTSDPFTNTEDVNNLRNNSFLIESLGTNSLCLYSNNGLHQVSHGNINLVSDTNILCQASHKLNLTSQGYILFNSERLLTSIEEDINILSSTGDVRLGGDGINGIGLKVNNNTDKNFTSLGRFMEKANRSLHIDIQDPSYDNTSKNGILIESKSMNNQNTFPDLKFTNYDKSSITANSNILTQMSLGLGTDNQDINNQIFAKKQNIEVDGVSVTHLISLNNFKFTSNDVNKVITYADTTISPDTIKTFINETTVIITIIQTDTQVNNFGYQEGYINRDNQGNIKTETNSDLHLGTNKNNIMTVKNTGNIGINSLNPQSTLTLENKYGSVKNIRNDKNLVYQSAQGIQMKNGNYILFYNTLQNNFYNLEANIYTINNDYVSTFIIYEDSYAFINFSIDNLKGIQDNLVVAYSIYNNSKYITKTKIFNQNGVLQIPEYSYTEDLLLASTLPVVKSFEVEISTGVSNIGYILLYRKQTATNKITIKVDLLPNNSNILISSQELTNKIDDNLIKDSIATDTTQLLEKHIKFISAVYNSKNNKMLLGFSGEFKSTDGTNEKTYYFSYLIQSAISYNSSTQIPNLVLAPTDFIKIHSTATAETLEILGFDIKVKDATNDQYVYAYYETDNVTSTRKIKKLKRHQFNYGDSSINNFDVILDNINGTIYASGYQYYQKPIINVVDTSNYYIVSLKGQKINYFSTVTGNNLELTEFTDTNMPFILSLRDINNNYLTTLVFFNNEDNTNPYLYQSVNFRELVSESSILNIKNINNDIKIKNTGDITIQDLVTMTKSNKSTQFEKLVIKTDESDLPTTGIVGELRVKSNKLYIFLNNAWREFSFA